jgi:hypothetical protein
MELIIFIIATLGMTDIIVNQGIFDKPRNWVDRVFHFSLFNELIHCEVCMGFWVGVGLSFLIPLPIVTPCNFFIAGLISSAVNKIVGLLLCKF